MDGIFFSRIVGLSDCRILPDGVDGSTGVDQQGRHRIPSHSARIGDGWMERMDSIAFSDSRMLSHFAKIGDGWMERMDS